MSSPMTMNEGAHWVAGGGRARGRGDIAGGASFIGDGEGEGRGEGGSASEERVEKVGR